MDNSDDVLKIKYLDENGIVMFYSRLNNRYKIVDSLPDIETVSPVDRHKLFILREIGTAGARYWPFVIEQDGWHNIGVTKSDIDGKYEKPVGGIPESDLAADVQGALGKADTAVQPNSLSTVASTGNYEDLNNKPELFSGDYNDLSNKPTIPAVDQSYNASSGNAQSGTAVAGALADVRQVPPAQSTDTGKILGVTDAAGTVGWVSPQVASQVNADWNATEGVAAILNKPNLAAVATSGSYNDLTDKPSIPSFTQSQEAAINSGVNSTKVNAYDGHVSDSDIHVTTQDKAAWDGKQDAIGDLDTIRSGAASGATAYQKPSGGIPSTDLSSAVQDSLGKADTAIQSHQDISGKADKVTSSTSGNFAALDASGNLTDSGNKAADFATSAQGALADSAYQLPAGGMPSTDMSHETQVSLGKADSAYQKPSGGIPDTDLSSGVQASLAKADTALQQHQDISGKVDKISGGTTGNLVALDSAGGISDSGKSLSDLQMKLTAGANITIDPNTNTISAVGGGGGGTTEYTAGPGIIISGTAIGVNAGSNLSIDSTTGVISATDTTYESKTASESGTDVSLVTTGEKYNWNAKYDKPSGGIPKADLASVVQNSLNLADSALQSHQDISGKADKAEMSVVPGTGNDADKTTITLKSGTSATVLTSHQDISDKQDVISDLDTIRAGAAGGATAYQKPSGGIPDTDLSSAVQTSLGKADTALQSHQDISGKADKVSSATNGNFAGLDSNGNLTDSGSKAADFATAAQGTLADSAYQKPSGGIPDTDLSSDVQASLSKADTALQSHQDISGKADKVSGATNGNFAGIDSNGNLTDSGSKASDFATAAQGTLAESAYQKPSGGIPDTDLSSAVQASLGKADTALQSHQDISGKADKVSGATNGNFAGLDSNGNLTDSGSKVSDFATAAQGTKADSAVQPGDLATVATSGSYSDLSNKPSIPTVDQSYSSSSTNAQSGTAVASAISGKQDTLAFDGTYDASDNKVATVSTVTNAVNGKADKSEMSVTAGTGTDADKTTIQLKTGLTATVLTAHQDISGKQDTISDLQTIREGASTGATAYQKPSGGIPDTDLSSSVQTSLGKADTALQSHQDISGKADKVSGATNGNFAGLDSNGNLTDSGSKAGDFATAAQGGKADTAVQPGDLATVATSGSYTDLSNTPDLSDYVLSSSLATVATSGSYADLSNTPDIPRVDQTYDGTSANAQSGVAVASAISDKADKVSGATNGNFAGLDTNGNLTDSGSKASDFATAAQGAKADSAYQKPSGGIPDTDLSSGVQASLGKADTAVQPGNLATVATSGSYTDLSNTPDLSGYALSSSLATVATSGDYNDLDNLPTIPTVDQSYDASSVNAQSGVAVASAISDKADKVSSATNGNFAGLDSNGNLIDSGSKASDFATAAQGAKADSAYQKPSGGIPDTDLSSSVQASLGKADTALQSHQDISGKADKVSGATNGNFAGLDSIGNLTDSGSKASDFATAAQGTLADSAYQKPSGGIPDTDLSSGVQASLAKADTALQSHQDISGKADKVSGATNGNFAGLDSNGNLTDSGSKASDFATSAQGTKADSAIQSVKVNGSALTPDANKAVDITVPAAQVNSDWNSSSGLSEILNKPDLSVYALKSEMSVVAGTGTDADKTTITLKSGAAATVLTAHQDITGKQDVISDLSTIRSGAEAGATAYQKPSGGIPDTDLSSGVQASLGKADTALQSHQDISGKADKVSGATNGNFAGLDSNGNLTDSGSKASDFATSAQGAKADSAYQKPSGGIPDTDLSSAVQTSLGKADTALQSHQDISGKADKVSGATNGNFAGLDSNGNLTDSGSKASDFATAAQGTLADSAYQLPSGGMPSTDMASAVQTSLGKADSAIQGVKVNSTALTPDANHIVDITINNATVTIEMAGTASSPNRSVGSFTVDQSAASTITIPVAVSAIPEVLDQNNEVVTAAVPAQPGVLSSGDKEKLDGLFNVTGSSTIAFDPSTHAVSAIVGPDGGVVAGASGLIVQPDLVSRVVYVGADCVYNDKTFWSDSATVDGIIADYANQTVTDYRGNGVPLARFVAEYDSNRYRIANIDETPGTVEYNRTIGGQIIDLMRSDFWMSSHPTYDITKFDKDMDELFDLLMTGSPMNAYLLLNNMTSTAFITDARRELYMDMIKAYDAWPYTDKDTAYADFMAEHALDRFVQVSTSWPLNSWNSYRYVMAGTKTATDKVIFVLRHAERGDDTSVNGDINSTGVTTCTTMGEQVRNNASWSSGGTTYRIDNFPANDATYYSTEYLRCKHSAQAFAEARYDTDFAASDYSGITVEADMLNQYRFFYQPASSGNSDLIRKYSVNPSQLTTSELSNYFGVSSAAEAQEKLSNDYVRVCKEILNKSTARLNMFYTHDFFTLPLAVMASNKYFDFSGNSSADNRNWINYCAGIGMVLHPDNTYEVMPVRGKSNGSMTI